jgi:hypothetical protein
MSPFADPLDKARAALEAAERRLAEFQEQHRAKSAELSQPLDFEENLSAREALAALGRKISAATDARDHARRALTAAEGAHAAAEADRRHAAAQKLARAGERLALDVVATAEKLAAALAALEANRAEVDAANAVRGDRPFIYDGERKLREIPAQTEPPKLEERVVYEDETGGQPTLWVQDPETGEMVPQNGTGSFKKRRKMVQVSEERFVPARMPERLSAAITLVGLRGERLWPTG